MRQAFRGYQPPTKDELERLWSDGLIVLDANALLHLFRYSAQTRDELIELLQKYQDRIWIPHQVGEEFHRNRRSVPVQESKSFAHVESEVKAAEAAIIKSIDALQRPTLEADRISKLTKKHLRKVAQGLRKIKNAHLAAVLAEEAHEHTFAVITDLYEDRVGTPFDVDETKEADAAGAMRYPKKVPPGYMDSNKNLGRKYGDLFVWRQMLAEGKARGLPMLFITDDVKEDWWDLSGGYASGPRAELVEEYYAATDQRIHFYTTRDFLDEAMERGEKISDASVEEARKVSWAWNLTTAEAAEVAFRTARTQVGDILNAYDHSSGLIAEKQRLASQLLLSADTRHDEWVTAYRAMYPDGVGAAMRAEMDERREFLRQRYSTTPTVTELLARDDAIVRGLRHIVANEDSGDADVGQPAVDPDR